MAHIRCGGSHYFGDIRRRAEWIQIVAIIFYALQLPRLAPMDGLGEPGKLFP
jgi:hypothetical protein